MLPNGAAVTAMTPRPSLPLTTTTYQVNWTRSLHLFRPHSCVPRLDDMRGPPSISSRSKRGAASSVRASWHLLYLFIHTHAARRWCIARFCSGDRDGNRMADQLISTAVHNKLPASYVRPETQRPRLDEVVPDAHIPVVDLASPDRAAVVSQIGAACRSHGFFQVLNHGIPVELMMAVMAVAHEFFRLPPEEKAKLYSDDPAKKMRLSTSFNVRKETVHNWRDYLRLHCHPLEQFVPDWPANPPPFREIVSTYCKEVRELGFRLCGAISESLGLEENHIKKVLGEQEQHMAVNFYPKCPEPDLTYGLPAHTDPNALTILLMDQQVAGLQVLKEGKWIAVNPRPNALVINIGDQLQALSNGRYKSVWHRAVVNSDRVRMSIASFLCPCNDVLIGPAEKLVSEDSTAVYRNYTYDEYYKKFWSRNLDQEHCLEFFRN